MATHAWQRGFGTKPAAAICLHRTVWASTNTPKGSSLRRWWRLLFDDGWYLESSSLMDTLGVWILNATIASTNLKELYVFAHFGCWLAPMAKKGILWWDLVYQCWKFLKTEKLRCFTGRFRWRACRKRNPTGNRSVSLAFPNGLVFWRILFVFRQNETPMSGPMFPTLCFFHKWTQKR